MLSLSTQNQFALEKLNFKRSSSCTPDARWCSGVSLKAAIPFSGGRCQNNLIKVLLEKRPHSISCDFCFYTTLLQTLPCGPAGGDDTLCRLRLCIKSQVIVSLRLAAATQQTTQHSVRQWLQLCDLHEALRHTPLWGSSALLVGFGVNTWLEHLSSRVLYEVRSPTAVILYICTMECLKSIKMLGHYYLWYKSLYFLWIISGFGTSSSELSLHKAFKGVFFMFCHISNHWELLVDLSVLFFSCRMVRWSASTRWKSQRESPSLYPPTESAASSWRPVPNTTKVRGQRSIKLMDT